MYDIITIGGANRDILIKDEHFQEIAESELKVPRDISPTDAGGVLPLGLKIEIQDVTIDSGGGATNAAVTFVKQGFSVACIAATGDDCEGHEIIEQLGKEGVKTLFQKSNYKTGFSFILISKNGERSILTFRGSSQDLKREKFPWNTMQAEWFYLSSLVGNEDVMQGIFSFAKEHNIAVAFNPGGRELRLGLKRLKLFLEGLRILLINKEEASVLVGFEGEKDIFKALAAVKANLITVITKGPQGVSVFDGKTIWQAGVFPEKARVDRTGAGDAFGSGFLTGIIRSGIEEGIRLGSANGTSVLEYMGAKKGILTREEFNDPRWQNLEIKKSSLV